MRIIYAAQKNYLTSLYITYCTFIKLCVQRLDSYFQDTLKSEGLYRIKTNSESFEENN